MPPRQRQFEDLVAQLRGDSPDPDRQSLWPALLADQWTACRDASSRTYTELVRQGVARVDRDVLASIEKDVHRTSLLPSDPVLQKRLWRTLVAYARRCPSTGYCQGMNFVFAALILALEGVRPAGEGGGEASEGRTPMPSVGPLGRDSLDDVDHPEVSEGEETAFWIGCVVLERGLPRHHDQTMSGNMVAFRTLSALLELEDGSLAAHIKSTGISMPLLCTQWFVSLYLHVLPTSLVFKLWDVAFAALALQGDGAAPEPPPTPTGQTPVEATPREAGSASEDGPADESEPGDKAGPAEKDGAAAGRTNSLLAVLHATALAIFQRVRGEMMSVTDADASVGLVRTYAEDRLLGEEEQEAFLAEIRRQILALDCGVHSSLQQRHAAQVRAEVAAVIRSEWEEVDLVFGPGPLGISVCEDDSGAVKVAKLLAAPDGSPGQAARLGGVASGSIITHVDGEFVGDRGRVAVKSLIATRPRPIAVRFLSDPCSTPSSYLRGDRSFSNLSTDSLGDSSYPQQPAKAKSWTKSWWGFSGGGGGGGGGKERRKPEAGSASPGRDGGRGAEARSGGGTASGAITTRRHNIIDDGFEPGLLPGERQHVATVAVLERAFQPRGAGLRPLPALLDGARTGDLGQRAREEVYGKVFLTEYRFVFHRFVNLRDQWAGAGFPDLHVPLGLIAQVQPVGARHLLILCRHGLSVSLRCFKDAEREGLAKLFTALALSPPPTRDFLFAFAHGSAAREQSGHGARRWPRAFDMERELRRIGVAGGDGWRVVRQGDRWTHCATYPPVFAVPACVSEAELGEVLRFRSRGRLPVPVWVHPSTLAVLSRSAQPLVGIGSQRSTADEKLVLALARAAGCASESHYILDARSWVAAQGNRAMGKGTENASYYRGCCVEHAGIGNIHAAREAYEKLWLVMRPEGSATEDDEWPSRLAATGWLKQVRLVLTAACRIVEMLELEGRSVLVHCSDGWDRATQLPSLAELMLDSRWRTVRGFGQLVEKHWTQFGHMFMTRSGAHHNAPAQEVSDSAQSLAYEEGGRVDAGEESMPAPTEAATPAPGTPQSPTQQSPVFLMWLDCVHQLVRQCPDAFEFTPHFLVAIGDLQAGGRFGNFLFDSARQRQQAGVETRTEDVWEFLEGKVLGSGGADAPWVCMRNPRYQPVRDTLHPSCHARHIAVWSEYFARWDALETQRRNPHAAPLEGVPYVY